MSAEPQDGARAAVSRFMELFRRAFPAHRGIPGIEPDESPRDHRHLRGSWHTEDADGRFVTTQAIEFTPDPDLTGAGHTLGSEIRSTPAWMDDWISRPPGHSYSDAWGSHGPLGTVEDRSEPGPFGAPPATSCGGCGHPYPTGTLPLRHHGDTLTFLCPTCIAVHDVKE